MAELDSVKKHTVPPEAYETAVTHSKKLYLSLWQ